MNHAKILAGLILSGYLTVGCASNDAMSSNMDAYQKAVADAKSELTKAKKAGFEWRDTGKMLKKADALAKKGDMSGAIALANKAKRQSEHALTQAASQANAGPRPM